MEKEEKKIARTDRKIDVERNEGRKALDQPYLF